MGNSYVAIIVAPIAAFFFYVIAIAIQTNAIQKFTIARSLGISVVPIIPIVGFAIWQHSLGYALVSTTLFAAVAVNLSYEKYVLRFFADDIATVMAIIPLIMIWPLNPGTIQSANLASFYSDTFQGALTLAGIVFAIGIFFLQSQDIADKDSIKGALRGFLSLFLTLAIFAAFGLINTHADLHVGIETLKRQNSLISPNSISAYIFFIMLPLLVGCLAYLVNVLNILLNPNARRINKVTNSAQKSDNVAQVRSSGLGWPPSD